MLQLAESMGDPIRKLQWLVYHVDKINSHLKNGSDDGHPQQIQAYDVGSKIRSNSNGPLEEGRKAKGPNQAKESFLSFFLDNGRECCS